MSDYTKTTFVEGGAPGLSAAEMNKIGQGIQDAHSEITVHDAETAAGVHGSTTDATPDTLAHRDANGDLAVRRLLSSIATGTSPLTVLSQTLVANLNADMLDGFHASAMAKITAGSGSHYESGGAAVIVSASTTWRPKVVLLYSSSGWLTMSIMIDGAGHTLNFNSINDTNADSPSISISNTGFSANIGSATGDYSWAYVAFG